MLSPGAIISAAPPLDSEGENLRRLAVASDEVQHLILVGDLAIGDEDEATRAPFFDFL
jgi:hypothetical protein